MGFISSASSSATGSAHLSTRNCRQSCCLRRELSETKGILSGWQHCKNSVGKCYCAGDFGPLFSSNGILSAANINSSRPRSGCEPVGGAADEDHDFGPRGIFSDVARAHSTQAWLSRHRKAITAGGVVVLSGVAVFLLRRIGN